VGIRPTCGTAWQLRASDLARWGIARAVNRFDLTYRYCEGGKQDITCDRLVITPDVLAAHFLVRRRSDILVPPSLDAGSMGKTADIDIDSHGPEGEPKPDPAKNRAYALVLYDRAVTLGFRPLLYTSDGLGGYHHRLLFAGPVDGVRLRAFARWLAFDRAKQGVARVECFPKQTRVTGDKPGNGLRLIGRHHTRDHWPEVFNGSEWLTGDAAVAHVLSLTGDSPDLIPDGIVNPPDPNAEPVPPGCPPREKQGAGDGWVEPADAYNRSVTFADVDALLQEAGAEPAKTAPGRIDYTRPGKDPGRGYSGNLKDCGGFPVFWNFSDNRPGFKRDKPYTPAGVLCVLKYGGDFRRMSDDLRARGFGSRVTVTWGGSQTANGQPPGAGPPRAGETHAGGTPGTSGSSSGGGADVPPWDDPVPFGEDGPAPPFPVDTLPAPIADYVTRLSEATQTPVDAPAMMVAAVAAGGLAKKFRFVIRPGWSQPANLNTTTAMAVGERKTTVQRHLLAPVLEAEAEAREPDHPRAELARLPGPELRGVRPAGRPAERREEPQGRRPGGS
jgi:hypothetical protein